MKEAGRIAFFHGLSSAETFRRVVFLLLASAVLATAAVSFAGAAGWIRKPFSGFLINRRMIYGGIGQYHWTGTRSDLRVADKILEANGRALQAPMELAEVVGKVEVGDSIRYAVARGGDIVRVEIPTMRFLLSDFLVLYVPYLVAGLAFLSIGSIVFIMKPDTPLSWTCFLISIAYSLSYFSVFDAYSTHWGLYRLYNASAGFAPFAGLHFTLLFPERKKIYGDRTYIPYLLYGLAAVVISLMEFTYRTPLYSFIYRQLLYLSTLVVILFLSSMIHTYVKAASALARQRAKVVLFGAAISFPIPAFMTIYAATVGEQQGGVRILTNFLVFPLMVFPASIAYAIARHNLFDVDVFIKRTVGYAIMTAVVGAAYLGFQVGLESLVLTPVFGEAAHKVTPILFAFLVVFLFNPLNRRVQEAVDRMFYRKKFDYKATVTAVSDALSSVLNLDEIVRKIVGTVHSEMFIDRSGLVLAGAQGGGFSGYFLDDAPSNAAEEIRRASLPKDDPIVKLVRERKKLVTKYDLAEDPHFAQVKDVCGRRFEELGASLAVPLLYRDEVKAVLTVGHKKSGHFFTREDVELLQTLASHGAVAIENAHMAEQMKKEETVRTNLSRYLSPQIVDRIVQNDVKVNLGGDRKVVTVLFSDIRNFTTITESRPPDQLVHILNEYFTEMAKIIFEHQGSLDKYIGDAVVAVFGSLIPLENPAKNAAAAAVAMMKRLPELNRRWEARYGFYMNIGIGVNTGEVFLGNIGSPERMEFTVIGDAVNVASRFSGLAKAGQILVTKETMAQLGVDFPVREHPPAEVKGKSGKLEVYEIMYTQSVI